MIWGNSFRSSPIAALSLVSDPETLSEPMLQIQSYLTVTAGFLRLRRSILGMVVLTVVGVSVLAGEVADDHNLLGRYETALPETGRDRGEITRHPTEGMKFRWTSDSGTSWDLRPNVANGLLEALDDKPNIQLQFEGKPGASAVRTIRIDGRLYFRKVDPAKKRAVAPVAEEPPGPATPGKVTKIDGQTYEVGNIRIHKPSKEIVFDACVNQIGGPIEYLLVTNRGKTHESLFSCQIRPIDLNVAFLLLGYEPSPELFEIRTPDHRPTGHYPKVPETVRSLARLHISATWTTDGKSMSAAVNDFIMNEETGKPMAAGPWLYTGSAITETGFRAEQTGDIAAVFSDPSAMINHPGKSRIRDDVWSVKRGPLPAKGATVKITIKPFFKTDTPHATESP